MDPFISRRDLFYRHSWKAPVGGLLLVGAAGLISTFVLGLIYGYAWAFIPIIHFKLVLLIGYPLAIGTVVSLALRAGNIRNDLVAILAGVGFGLLAEYMGWVAWTAAVLRDAKLLIVFFYPGDLIYFMQEVSRDGTFIFSEMQPTGFSLYLLWLVEAVIVIGGTEYMTIHNHLEDPFCEDCHAWVAQERYIGLFTPLSNESKFKHEIRQGNFQSFMELKAANVGNRFTKITTRECKSCKTFRLVTVKSISLWVNAEKKIESKTQTIINNLRVTSELLPTLERLAQLQDQLR